MLPFLDAEYLIDCGRRLIDPAVDRGLELVLLCYLSGAREMPLDGRWVSERSLRGGDLFFAGPHALPTAALAARFAHDAAGFAEAGRAAGGVPAGYGDASFRLQVLPRVPVIVVLWVADDEFPARASFLFDSTADAHLPLDAILALAGVMSRKLMEAHRVAR